MRLIRFALQEVSPTDAAWLQALLTREGQQFGTRAEPGVGTELRLRW